MLLLLLLVISPAVYSKKIWEGRGNESCVNPPTAFNTTERLAQLREQFELYNISAYIVTSNDEHQSEYVAERDQRRQFISGFSGSAGTAVVTKQAAALWTDSRYYIQASHQLDCNWLLMKSGESDTPSLATWLEKILEPGAVVSADAKTTSYLDWEQWRTDLETKNVSLMITSENLVDLVWGDERPGLCDKPLEELNVTYTGQEFGEKLAHLREDMAGHKVDTLILTALDEIAWTLNLRGCDVPFTPVFMSYLVIETNQTTLYLRDSSTNHTFRNPPEISIKSYETFWEDLQDIGMRSNKIGLPTRYSYAQGVSYLLHTMIPSDKIVDLISPALIRKDTKNDVEGAAMREAHIQDGVALCVFFAQMHSRVPSKDYNYTELTAARYLDEIRERHFLNRGPSFETIAAVGVNAAMPHYEPTEETDRPLTINEMFLVDSGGQYLGGTTDVTRTVHFGEPLGEYIEMYTRLLRGCIDLVTTIFPEKSTLNDLEVLLRRPLYQMGLNYGHGSTHGIGSMLSVHEAFNTTYHLNFYGSQEPGYYKEGEFGIRLENIVRVVRANTTSGANNFLTFETVTLVPYARNLIDVTLLEQTHIDWINAYHAEVEKLVGSRMLEQSYQEEHQWLLQQTAPLTLGKTSNRS